MTLQEIREDAYKKWKKAERTYMMLNGITNEKPEDIMNADVFFTLISNLSAQSKAPTTEKWLANKLGWKRVKSSLGQGDFVDKNGKYYELKCSYSNKAETLNFRQVRLWQNIDYYIGIYVDEDKLDYYLVFLTKEQMRQEASTWGATHGTKTANKFNNNVELSHSIKINSTEMTEWLNKYSNPQLYKKLFG